MNVKMVISLHSVYV